MTDKNILDENEDISSEYECNEDLFSQYKNVKLDDKVLRFIESMRAIKRLFLKQTRYYERETSSKNRRIEELEEKNKILKEELRERSREIEELKECYREAKFPCSGNGEER